MILQKYGEDKTKLTDFYLASCEVGLTENGTSFAKEFSDFLLMYSPVELRIFGLCFALVPYVVLVTCCEYV